MRYESDILLLRLEIFIVIKVELKVEYFKDFNCKFRFDFDFMFGMI